MTTMVVRIDSGASAGKIAAAMRQLKGVAEVKIHNGSAFERIPGLPYTDEERIARVRKAMAGHHRGERGITQEELKKEVALW